VLLPINLTPHELQIFSFSIGFAEGEIMLHVYIRERLPKVDRLGTCISPIDMPARIPGVEVELLASKTNGLELYTINRRAA
jgi:hypothetical protein